MNHKIVLVALSVLLLGKPTSAADGDTQIYISYKTKSVRVKPFPRTDGAVVDIRLVLHSNGTVEEKSTVQGGAKGKNKGKFGEGTTNDGYKVIDASTITRTKSSGNYFHSITVKVTGKNCMAMIMRKLKPGETLFAVYLDDVKGTAYYSSIENEYTTCVIE